MRRATLLLVALAALASAAPAQLRWIAHTECDPVGGARVPGTSSSFFTVGKNAHTEAACAQRWTEGAAEPDWSIELKKGSGFSSLAVTEDGDLLAGGYGATHAAGFDDNCDGVVLRLNAKTGAVVWRADRPFPQDKKKSILGRAALLAGISSNGHIVVIDLALETPSYVAWMSQDSGKQIAKYHFPEHFTSVASMSADGKWLFSRGRVGQSFWGRIAAINASEPGSGMLWQTEGDSDLWGLGPVLPNGAASKVGGCVFTGCGEIGDCGSGLLSCKDGSQLWWNKTATARGEQFVDVGDIVVKGSREDDPKSTDPWPVGTRYEAIESDTGKWLWTAAAPRQTTAPNALIVSEGDVYASGNAVDITSEQVMKIELKTGSMEWNVPVKGTFLGTGLVLLDPLPGSSKKLVAGFALKAVFSIEQN